MKKKNLSKGLKLLVQGLPLAGAALLPVSRLGTQVVMLIVLVWLQVFFIVECFLAGR
jgi:hypothetical protein